VSIDEREARCDALLTDLRDVIATAVPGGAWTEVTPAQRVGDGEVASVVSTLHGYDRPLPAGPERGALLARLDAVAAQYGFGPLQPYLDTDDELQAVAGDADGTAYELGSRARTTLYYRTAPAVQPR
jgi:hypothetical protein